MNQVYLGIDVGSVSTKFAVVDVDGGLVDSLYLRTDGQPIRAIQQGLETIEQRMDPLSVIDGVGATGSARRLAGVLAGADVIRNEITAHSVAALRFVPDVRTIIEIGGQDSKLIIVRDGVVTDFAMNTVCAAGTGSFLDHQASRLGVPISEFGSMALSAKHPVRIAGRCGVFAESDMIHKQQAGYATEDIVAGLCEALVRNYLNNVARGKRIEGPVVFQGGVAANLGIRAAFERSLEQPVIVPQRYEVMGAIGAAYLAQETTHLRSATAFRGFQISQANCRTTAFDCQGCPNLCEVVEVRLEGEVLARWGDRCGKWSHGELANGAM